MMKEEYNTSVTDLERELKCLRREVGNTFFSLSIEEKKQEWVVRLGDKTQLRDSSLESILHKMVAIIKENIHNTPTKGRGSRTKKLRYNEENSNTM